MTSFVQYLSERFGSNVEPEDVLSKLSALNKQVDDNRSPNTTIFGLEDSHGNIVKVYVRTEQASEFEKALSLEMDADDEQSSQEIAEVLYRLHDRFDITDVKWPTIEEDEEGDETSAQDFESSEGEGDMNMETDPNAAPDAAAGGNLGGEDKATSALDTVLQALIANAEADRQEALAKAAEARAREAEAAAKMAEQKLKSEEEVADMEAFYTAQNDEKKEAKKLAKLAKYRHTINQREDGSGPFNDARAALAAQQRDSEERMDMPSGENPPGTDPSGDISDIQPEIEDVGFENEEIVRKVNRPMTVNNQHKDLKTAVKFLHSLRVRRAIHND